MHDVRVLLQDKPGLTLFDVGANIGQTVAEFLATFQTPRIYAFEPSPGTFTALRHRYGSSEGVLLENIALDCHEGMRPFHVTRDHSVNDSLLRPTWDAGGEEVQVAVETLDGYARRHGIQSIDLLKIDTQGNDLNVLRGAEQLLSKGLIRLFSIEVMFTAMYDGQPTLVDIMSFAGQARYELIGVYEQTYIGNRMSYFNACFGYAGR